MKMVMVKIMKSQVFNRILSVVSTRSQILLPNYRSSRPEVFLRKGVLKICSKFTGEHPCRSLISIKLLSNFIEIALRHGCSPVSLLNIFRTPFPKNTSGWLLLKLGSKDTFFKNWNSLLNNNGSLNTQFNQLFSQVQYTYISLACLVLS